MHSEQPVPDTAPQTPDLLLETTAASPAQQTGSVVPVGDAGPSLGEALMEGGVTAVCATAGAIGGAIAGEMLGGDLATSHVGPMAAPLGQE